jgi:hypothetical protein
MAAGHADVGGDGGRELHPGRKPVDGREPRPRCLCGQPHRPFFRVASACLRAWALHRNGATQTLHWISARHRARPLARGSRGSGWSAQSSFGLGFCRRSTATSWRSTKQLRVFRCGRTCEQCHPPGQADEDQVRHPYGHEPAIPPAATTTAGILAGQQPTPRFGTSQGPCLAISVWNTAAEGPLPIAGCRRDAPGTGSGRPEPRAG